MSAASLFIYWHCRLDQATEAEAAARDFQARARVSHPDLTAQLYRRCDAELARVTLMETYSCAAGLPKGLSDEAAADLAPWALSGRHVEVFERLS